MKNNEYVHYYVEGQDEEKLLSVLKTDMELIIPGKIQVFNITQEVLTKLRLMQLKDNTRVVLVYDTDTEGSDTLLENVQILKSCSRVKEVVCVPQVKNLEDELKRCCEINQIKELTGSKSNKEYKSDLIKEKNLKSKLEKNNFNFGQMWSKIPQNEYKIFGNDSEKIKTRKSM